MGSNKHVRPNNAAGLAPVVRLLKRYGMEMDLEDERYKDAAYLALPATQMHIQALVSRCVSRFGLSKDLWLEAQAEGLLWRHPQARREHR